MILKKEYEKLQSGIHLAQKREMYGDCGDCSHCAGLRDRDTVGPTPLFIRVQ